MKELLRNKDIVAAQVVLVDQVKGPVVRFHLLDLVLPVRISHIHFLEMVTQIDC